MLTGLTIETCIFETGSEETDGTLKAELLTGRDGPTLIIRRAGFGLDPKEVALGRADLLALAPVLEAALDEARRASA